MIHRRNHGRGHSYWDGEGAAAVKLPGVTSIVSECMAPSRGLRRWPGKVTARYAVDYWDQLSQLRYSERLDQLLAAQDTERTRVTRKGTQVHRVAELLIETGPDEPEVEVPDELVGYAQNYAAFLDAYSMKTVAVELVIANRKVGYCGTLDVIGDLPEVSLGDELLPPARWLLDVKSGASGVWPEAAIQTCAYSRAEVYLGTDGQEHPFSELGVQRCGAIHVREDGWDLIPLVTGAETWSYFQHLAWLWYHGDAVKTWVGAAADPPDELLGGSSP